MVPAHRAAYPGSQVGQVGTSPLTITINLNKTYWWALVGIISCLIQGKEGGIQVLAGLAPSSQTVGSNKERTGATKGGS